MKIIGMTGGSGAGKSEVCGLFAGYGVESIDTDRVARAVTRGGSACLKELTRYFSEVILDNRGELDRKKLADAVFADKSKLEILNKITHKYILESCMNSIKDMESAGKNIVIIDAPLLFESGFNEKCDIIISVIADLNERIRRIINRDNLTSEQAVRRIENQKTDDFFLKHSDYIIYNNGALKEVEPQVAAICADILG